MTRIRRIGLRALTASVIVLGLAYLATFAYFAFQIRRAGQFAAAMQQVRVGDAEDSLKTLRDRFGSHTWTTQLGAKEDFNYTFEMNPWHFPTLASPPTNGHEPVMSTGFRGRLRRATGLRHWMMFAAIAIKDHRVAAVQTEVYLEGSSHWLGTYWRLAQKPREFDRQPDVDYLEWPPKPNLDFVTPGMLEMGTGGGTIWEFWISPTFPAEQSGTATRWELRCLDSFQGCKNLCDLLPNATRFFREHAELAPKGGGWDESSRSCRTQNDYGPSYF